MALKSGYKQTEAGVIPEDWDARTLGSIGRPVRGGSPRPAGDPRYFNGSFIPWLTVAAMTNIPSSQLTVLETETFLTESGSQLSRMLDPGTLIIANSGATLGVAKILGIKCCANDGIAALLNIKLDVSPIFLAHLINAKTDYLREVVATGNGQPNLNTKLISALPVQLPPKRSEQDAIADSLSDADALIESLEQLLVKKRQIKQGAMQELLTGKKRLPGFTYEWREISIGSIGRFRGGSGFPICHQGADSGDYPFFKVSDMNTDGNEIFMSTANHYITRQIQKQISASTFSTNCIIFAKVGAAVFLERKRMLSQESCIDNNMAGFEVDESQACVRFVHYLFLSLRFSDLANTTALPSLSGRSLSTITLVLPAINEQTAIAEVLSDMEAEIGTLEARLSKVLSLKQGMMQELLTGRIRLVRPSAEVLSFPAKGSASNAKVSHNTQINEAVVIAVLSAKFGSEKFPLGRFRRTKFSYLLHRHTEHEAAGFMKKAAGPYNPRTRYGGAETIALTNRYVRVLSTGNSEGFVADENIAQAEGYFEKWYGAEALTWLEQFRYQKNDALELLTTVDMACEDLSREGKAATLSAVKQIIQDSPEWRAKLNRAVFSDDNIATTIQSCGQLFPVEKE